MPSALVLSLASCHRDTDEANPSSDVAASPMVTLTFDLPHATMVTLDDGKPVPTPVPAQEVAPGSHRVTVTTPCDRVTLDVELDAGGDTVIRTGDVPGLESGTIAISARALGGQRLAHSVFLDDMEVTARVEESTVVVPACEYRMRVVSEGVGGFMEDIDLSREPSIRRTLVLAPGPDMVRIHGGPFTLGPPESNLEEYGRWDTPRKDVEIETFDMDRTEVTAKQFYECRQSGECSWDIGVVGGPKFPPGTEASRCASAVAYGPRQPKQGQESNPMNCVSLDEAKMYCESVGKRLPTASEWEFAARSRNRDYYCPWPPPADIAGRSPTCEQPRAVDFALHDVCAMSDDITEQGLCDMALGVTEFVTDETLERGVEDGIYTRGTWNSAPGLVMFDASLPFHSRYRYRPKSQDQDIRIGFRCARSIPGSTVPSDGSAPMER